RRGSISSRSRQGSLCCANAMGSRPNNSNGATRHMSMSTTRCRSTFSPARPSSASRSSSRLRLRRSPRAGRLASHGSKRSGSPICFIEAGGGIRRLLRQHRAAERLLKRLGQVLFGLGADIESAVLLREAFDVENALLAGPRKILHAETDD